MDSCYTREVTVSSVPDELPTLEELGILEVEPAVIEDTYENRMALRRAGYRWTQVMADDDDDGQGGLRAGIPLIKTLDTHEQRQVAFDKLERKAEVMVDPEDIFSDYVSPLELLADSPVPFWVKKSATKWLNLVEQGIDPVSRGHTLPRRCKVVKANGTRCWAWAGASKAQYETQMCRSHLNADPQQGVDAFTKRAKQKLYEAAPAAADMLEALSQTAEQESVRLRASTEILDRIGVKGGTDVSGEITVTHVNASEAVRERLDKLREARNHRIAIAQGTAEMGGEIVDAEVVTVEDERR